MSAQKYKDIYQDGSAARNIYTAAPVPDEFYDEYNKEELLLKRERQLRQKKRKAQMAAKQRAVAAKKKRSAIIVICAAVAVLVAICSIHLVSRGAVAGKEKEAAILQQELTELVQKNEALEAEINAEIDYEAIKATAMKEYGMVYPADGQIITYNADDEGYVKQYKDM